MCLFVILTYFAGCDISNIFGLLGLVLGNIWCTNIDRAEGVVNSVFFSLDFSIATSWVDDQHSEIGPSYRLQVLWRRTPFSPNAAPATRMPVVSPTSSFLPKLFRAQVVSSLVVSPTKPKSFRPLLKFSKLLISFSIFNRKHSIIQIFCAII